MPSHILQERIHTEGRIKYLIQSQKRKEGMQSKGHKVKKTGVSWGASPGPLLDSPGTGRLRGLIGAVQILWGRAGVQTLGYLLKTEVLALLIGHFWNKSGMPMLFFFFSRWFQIQISLAKIGESEPTVSCPQANKHHTSWWNVYCLLPKVKNKRRVSSVPTSIQDHSAIRQENYTKHPKWKATSKNYDHQHRKANGLLQKDLLKLVSLAMF